MIEIHQLYKYYDDRRAIGPINTTIETGQVVGLLGLNGAGKTTTLRILACDLIPTSGSVQVEGLDIVAQADDVKAQVGYLPDTPPLYPEMSVEEFLGYAARLRGVRKSDVKKCVQDAIEQTELDDERHTLIEALSHGFRQRVGIAQAIVHRPKMVVLDEPISGLDPAQIVEMRKLVRGLSGERTVLVSSHNLSEISETCDRLLVIKDGCVVADGSERELASAQEGTRIDVTLRGEGPSGEVVARARETLIKLTQISNVEAVEPSEVGEGIVSLSVTAQADIRGELCSALVHADFSVLELLRTQHELENIFLQLSAKEQEDAS